MMKIPEKLIKLLEDNGVGYETLRHPEAYTAMELAEAEHVKGRRHAKVVIVKSGEDLVMAVLPSDRMLDLERFEAVTGKNAKLADEEEFKSRFPDCEVGTMPPFGGLYGLPTYVDVTLREEESFVCEAGTHTDAIRIAFRDFERLAEPTFVDVAIKMHSSKAA
jgi:Ala-tRNA(Pro) deacylase